MNRFALLVEAYHADTLSEADEARLVAYLQASPKALAHLRSTAAIDDGLRELARQRAPAAAMRQAVEARIRALDKGRDFRRKLTRRIAGRRRRASAFGAWGAVGASLAAACLVVALVLGWPARDADADAIAHLQRAPGSGLRVVRSNRSADHGEALRAGDRLEGAGDSATLVFNDGTRITMDGDVAATLVGGQHRTGGGGKLIEFTRGAIDADVAHQPAGQDFTILTPHARVTVVGTRFHLAVSDASTRLAVSEGRVAFTERLRGSTTAVRAGESVEAWDATGAAPVFEAGFDGPGPGAGGPTDLVLSGATGRLDLDTTITKTFATAAPLAQGGGAYLHCVVTTPTGQNHGLAGFNPTSPEHAFGCFNQGTVVRAGRRLVVLNGAFDTIVRLNAKDPSDCGAGAGRSGKWFFPFVELNPLHDDGISIGLMGLADGAACFKVQRESRAESITDVVRVDGHGTPTGPATALLQIASAPDLLSAAPATWHIAVTLATDAQGTITGTLYAAPGAVSIDTRSATHRVARSTFTLDAATVGDAPVGSGGWGIGMEAGAQGTGTSVDYDLVRIYRAEPRIFPPAPTAAARPR